MTGGGSTDNGIGSSPSASPDGKTYYFGDADIGSAKGIYSVASTGGAPTEVQADIWSPSAGAYFVSEARVSSTGHLVFYNQDYKTGEEGAVFVDGSEIDSSDPNTEDFPTWAPPAGPATISGAVTDAKGTALAGATITITPQAGGSPAVLTSGGDGSYTSQATLTPGTYTVTASGVPTGQSAKGAYNITACPGTSTPNPPVCTLTVGPGGTAAVNFVYTTGFKLSGQVTYADANHDPVKNLTVTISGTTTDGSNVSSTATTDSNGNYSTFLDQGTYRVSPDAKYQPTATSSSDCQASGGTCTVNLNQDRTANFTVKCQPKLDFQTSMVAVGCFIPVDAAAGTWKAQGAFLMDGVDFQSTDDSSDPVMFDDQKKTVNGDQVKMWLSGPGFDGKWFGFYVPGGMHLSFPFTEEKTTWAFSTPWATPGGVVGKGIGYLSALGGGTQTLFGFPAHAPAAELTFDAGQTTLQMQISFPPTTGAFLDPINGLWKVPNGRGGVKIDYPLAFRAKITATNDVGVSQIEGSVAFANVYGIDTANNKFVPGVGGAPPPSTVELARLGFNWQLAQGVLHAQALLVIHGKTSAVAQDYAKKWLGPLDAFLGKTLVNVDAAFKWVTAIGNLPVPGLVNLSVQVNNINKYIPDTPGLFWQRFGLDGGIDVNNPLSPWTIGGNLGFTWLPRFKSDYVWFQEVASLDGSATFDFDPFSFNGTLDFKVANATIIHGQAKLDHSGLFVSGDLGFDLNQVLRVRFPASIKGTGRISLPTNTPTLFGGFQIDGEGKVNVWTRVWDGKLVLNGNGAGLCVKDNTVGTQGIYFDGSWHVGGCNQGPFASAIATGASSNEPTGSLGPNDKRTFVAAGAAAKAPSFTLTRRSHVHAVAVLGAGAPPQFELKGPGGVALSTPTTTDAIIATPVSLIVNASDRTTYILLRGAKPGKYTLTPLAGSAPVAGLQFAAPLPPPSVHASIATQGCGRVLRWHLRSLPGQRVAIEEQQGSGSPRPLVVTDSPSGAVAYTPDPGTPAVRTIVAVVAQQGTPRATIVLARVRASTGVPPAKVTGLRARRAGTRITLSWVPVCAASYYYVAAGSGKTLTEAATSKTTIVIAVAKKARRIPISVTAVGPTDTGGRAASITVR